MENQKLLDLDTDIPEHEPKTTSSVVDDGLLSGDIKNNYENDDLILMPDKVMNTDKQLPLENNFEVIDQELKIIHDGEGDTEDTNISKEEEKDNLLDIVDPVSNIITQESTTLLTTESPIMKEPAVSENIETPVLDSTKTLINQDNEPINVVQPEVKIADIPEVVPKVSTKKDTDEGDVCDIKIGPEELFCRIGLGNYKINMDIFLRYNYFFIYVDCISLFIMVLFTRLIINSSSNKISLWFYYYV